ncbi:MAG: hypothetical protein U0169_24895 [Polyangiaceae bacterium]
MTIGGWVWRVPFALLVTLATIGCKREEKKDPDEVIAKYQATIVPLADVFDRVDDSCDASRLEALHEKGTMYLDVDELRGLARGEVVKSTFPFRAPSVPIAPPESMDKDRRPIFASRLAQVESTKLYALVHVEELVKPIVTGPSPGEAKNFTPGRVRLRIAFVEYPEGKPICRIDVEAENGPTALVRHEPGSDQFYGLMSDLQTRTEYAFDRRFNPLIGLQ